MNTGVKITQLRIPAEVYEAVREQAHERRQSRNQFMIEAIWEKIEALRKLEYVSAKQGTGGAGVTRKRA